MSEADKRPHVLLAELLIRHTRRHMPTRRVALGSAYLPMTGGGYGALLLGAVVSTRVEALADEQRDALPGLLHAASRGLEVPQIKLWYRLQTDTHGLDRSRHRVFDEGGQVIVELDAHGASAPQILGSVLAVAVLPPTTRTAGLLAIRDAIDGRFRFPKRVLVRRLEQGMAPDIPWAPGVHWQPGAPEGERKWAGVASERRWALEVLGFGPMNELERDEVNRRFRRLLRDAHPDSGGHREAAADRIAELSEARELLLDEIEHDAVASAHFSAGE
jgi:hypothetical protein